ncbi:MAG: SLC13 family permease [Rhodobiaceae bacterium]|nr:SLC13 family permease [Rhodobiaceae bacterium]
MTIDQILLFSLFVIVFALMLWGRFRYDLVAFSALCAAVVLGLLPTEDAFAGFGHPATIIVAIVLVVSRGLVNSGAVDLITRRILGAGKSLASHIAVMAGLGAFLSAFMNNVAALALLMPVDMSAASKAGRSPALSLMPLSFATILGGMVTLIGTPPNIIIAAYRESALGDSYRMFDFAPVGLVVTVAGILFVALVGWRLIPVDPKRAKAAADLMDLDGYTAELVIEKKSPAVGRIVGELDGELENDDVQIVGLVRNGRRLPGAARREEIRAGDYLIVNATAEAIDTLVGQLKLSYIGKDKIQEEAGRDLSVAEIVVPRDSRIEGRTSQDVRLLARHGVSLLGVSRRGVRFRKRVRHLTIQAGDIMLILGPTERLAEVTQWLGALPLAERGLNVTQHGRAAFAGGLFAAAIIAASLGLVYLPVALSLVVIAYVLFDIVPLRQVYEEIEWPVVVLLGSMIPLGTALEQSGGTALIAQNIVNLSSGLPSWAVLTILMIVTMTLSDVLNNTATAVIAAPIAVDVANRLGANPDPFLMAVAVAASCAFLTPIGHKNNTLILGPGGYAFGDYWRMGLPLEILVVAIGVPAIMVFWPL